MRFSIFFLLATLFVAYIQANAATLTERIEAAKTRVGGTGPLNSNVAEVMEILTGNPHAETTLRAAAQALKSQKETLAEEKVALQASLAALAAEKAALQEAIASLLSVVNTKFNEAKGVGNRISAKIPNAYPSNLTTLAQLEDLLKPASCSRGPL